jgi:hypothetical protein
MHRVDPMVIETRDSFHDNRARALCRLKWFKTMPMKHRSILLTVEPPAKCEFLGTPDSSIRLQLLARVDPLLTQKDIPSVRRILFNQHRVW